MVRGLLNRLKRWVLNRYEAAWVNWGQRSWLWQGYQDARFDADKCTRQELQRKHRHWVVNNGICSRIRDLFLQFSVGWEGLRCTPNSSDETWNVARKASFEMWADAPMLDSHLTLAQATRQWSGSLFDDGEVFIHLTSFRGRPMLCTYEAHRCATPSDRLSEEGKTIVDGVQIDANLKPVGYWIRDGNDPNDKEYKLIPADEVIHIFKARRPGMLRGLPEGYTVMNVLHDLDDLQMYQMQKAKAAAIVAMIIKNASGEADPATFRRSRLQIQTTNAANQVINKDVPQFYDEQLSAYKMYLKNGEDAQVFRAEDPSVVVQQYWEFLISLICAGYNVPKLLVFPYSLQGTAIRADLDVCTGGFCVNFELIRLALQRIYRWQTSWAVRFDRSMDGRIPTDPLSVVIRPPRPPNVDIGYSADAVEKEMQLGLKTIQDYYAERQQDWRAQLEQIAEAQAYINELAEKFNISPNQISQLALPGGEASPADNSEVEQEGKETADL